MSKGKVLVVLVFVAMAAGAGGALITRHYMAGEHGRSGARSNALNFGSYTVHAHCTNCGWEGTVQVPKGESVEKVACPKCEWWNPSVPERGGGTFRDVAWREKRKSSLITQDKWELRKAYAAGGGRR
jgi:hypothetical protein